MQGNPQYPVPSRVPHDGSLYVGTTNGALVAISAAKVRIILTSLLLRAGRAVPVSILVDRLGEDDHA